MKKAKKSMDLAGENAEKLNSLIPTEQEHRSTLGEIRSLAHVPERKPDRVEAGRQAFLSDAHDLSLAVSSQPNSRHRGWTNIFKKERSPMLTLARIILLAAFALGGTGATAYAAQESLPDQSLYPVKTWIEDLRLRFSADPQAEFDLLAGFVEERIGEIEAMVGDGNPVPENVATRLATHLQRMAWVAADMDDPALLNAMEQVRTRSQVQVQRLEMLRENAPANSQALGLATQAMHNMRNTAEDAVQDPLSFRLRQGTNQPVDEPSDPPVGEGPANGPGPAGTQGPKKQNGAGQ